MNYKDYFDTIPQNTLILYDYNESYTFIDFRKFDEKTALEIRKFIVELFSVYENGYEFDYKFRQGLWDGKKRFYTIDHNRNLFIPKGLIKALIKKLEERNVSYEYKESQTSLNVPKWTETEIKEYIENTCLPFKPYDYQEYAVIKSLQDKRKVNIMATSSGKSLTISLIAKFLKDKGYKGVLIVPSVSLVNQFYDDMRDYFPCEDISQYVHRIHSGLPKHFDKPITITTWQSWINVKNLKDHFEELDFIIIDEVQSAKADVLSNTIIPNAVNCPIRLGFTGTLPTSFSDRMTIVSGLGKSEVIITPKDLIKRGMATPVEIYAIYLNYSDEDKMLVKKEKNYQKEKQFVETHYKRNMKIIQIAEKVVKKNNGENVLVMFDTIKHGLFLLELVLKSRYDRYLFIDKITKKKLVSVYQEFKLNPCNVFINEYNEEVEKKFKRHLKDFKNDVEFDSFLKHIKSLDDENVYIIYGDIEADQREAIRKKLETKKSAIIIGSMGTMATGINIKNLHHIILAHSTKSFVLLNQTIGRGMRLHSSKEKVVIYDIIDDLSTVSRYGKVSQNHLLKHSEERISQYMSNEYPIKEVELKL